MSEPRRISNKYQRECKRCKSVPDELTIIPRPEDIEANRTWLSCPDCDQFVCWANKEESGAVTKTCRTSEFPTAVRLSILKRDNFTCQACGRKAPDVILHIDHIVPALEGGKAMEANGITLCQECNLGKGKSYSVLDAFRLWIKTVKEDEVGSGRGS